MKSRITMFFLSLLLVFPGSAVLAADELDLEDKHGNNLNEAALFEEGDIYPGFSKTKEARIINRGNETADAYLEVDIKGDDELADQLKLYVIRQDDDSYRIGGEGDRMRLDDADGERLFIDRFEPDEGRWYDIEVTFDEEAGNEYQGKEIEFNFDFNLESESADTRTPAEILADEGRTGFTGEEPVAEGEQETAAETPGAGAAATGDETEIRGEQSERCQGWPLWVWLLALAVTAVLFLGSLFYKFKEQKVEGKIRRGAPAAVAIAGLAFWYFFDECNEYRWFALAVVIGGTVIYLLYLYLFKKGAGETGQSGSGEISMEGSSKEENETSDTFK